MIKQLAKKSSVYLAAKIIAALVGFFTLPILVRLISQEDIGLIVYFNSIVPLAIVLVYLGTEGAMVRLYFDHKKEDVLFSNIFFIASLMIFIILLGLLLQTLFFPSSDQVFIYIVISYIIFSGFKNYLLSYFRIKEKEKAFFVVFIFLTIILFSFQISGAYYFEDAYYVLAGKVLAELIALVVALYFMYKHLSLKYVSKNEIYDILKYAIPILPYAFSLYAINMTDKLFIKHFLGLNEVAVYGVAFTFIAAISIFSSSIDMAWGPYFYKNIKDKPKEHFSRIITIVYGLLAFVAMFIILFANEIVTLVYGLEYIDAGAILSILMFGAFIYAFYFFPVKSINYKRKNLYTAILAAVVMVANIVLNYIFIINFGIMGAAIATTLSNFIFVIVLILIAEKVFPIYYEYKSLFFILLAVLLSLIISIYFDFSISEKVIFLIIFTLVIGVLLSRKFKQLKYFEEQA